MKLLSANEYHAALYCRLSRDEDARQESNSVTNQRRILSEYAESNGYPIHDFYVDDGWSGVNYDRPEFQRMMKDIEDGKVNMVIVKDACEIIGLNQ